MDEVTVKVENVEESLLSLAEQEKELLRQQRCCG